MINYILLAACMVLVSSFTQILLKKSANEQSGGIRYFLNSKVIIGYFLFFVVTFINSKIIYKNINLSTINIIESFGYIFVPLLSWILLKEKLNRKMLIGIGLIILGIIIFVW